MIIDKYAKIVDLTKKLEIKIKKRNDLYEDLNKSLDIQKIWPEAFDNGSVKCQLSGTLFDLKNMKVRMRNSIEEKIFKLFDLPGQLQHHYFSTIMNNATRSQKPVIVKQLYINNMIDRNHEYFRELHNSNWSR